MAKNFKTEKNTIILNDSIGIENCTDFHKALLKLVRASENSLYVDMRSVEDLDACAIQLLVAFVREARDNGKGVSIIGPINESLYDKLVFLDYIRRDGAHSFLFSKSLSKGVQIECE